jgi:Na+-translocating ferredoxin:NAD+ oxidoreductase subunit B
MRRVDATAIDALLPQTQCTRCGYAGCAPYAQALAAGSAQINQCPPGGAALIRNLAALLDCEPLALDPQYGMEAPARLAWIDPAECIGCARCLPPCPVDAILGAQRQMHSVIGSWCTGCELCLPACPVDCIHMLPWPQQAAPPPAAPQNRARYRDHVARHADAVERRARELTHLKQRAAPDGSTAR